MGVIGVATTIVTGVEVYLAVGCFVAGLFVSFGIARALPDAGPVTVGARVMILPGVALLWPVVILRWLRPK